eukprot:Clim_evm37s231 gene=Clim_evmTU37s231
MVVMYPRKPVIGTDPVVHMPPNAHGKGMYARKSMIAQDNVEFMPGSVSIQGLSGYNSEESGDLAFRQQQLINGLKNLKLEAQRLTETYVGGGVAAAGSVASLTVQIPCEGSKGLGADAFAVLALLASLPNGSVRTTFHVASDVTATMGTDAALALTEGTATDRLRSTARLFGSAPSMAGVVHVGITLVPGSGPVSAVGDAGSQGPITGSDGVLRFLCRCIPDAATLYESSTAKDVTAIDQQLDRILGVSKSQEKELLAIAEPSKELTVADLALYGLICAIYGSRPEQSGGNLDGNIKLVGWLKQFTNTRLTLA